MISIQTLAQDAKNIQGAIEDMSILDDPEGAIEVIGRIRSYLETQSKLAEWEFTGVPPGPPGIEEV